MKPVNGFEQFQESNKIEALLIQSDYLFGRWEQYSLGLSRDDFGENRGLG